MAIPYQTAKFKINILAIEILGSTAKFNSRQYFWLYGKLTIIIVVIYLSVPPSCVTMYCSGVSLLRSSSSLNITYMYI